MGFIRFHTVIIRIGIELVLLGQLKFRTTAMMGLAAESSQRGIMSYSKFSRLLTK